MRRRRLPRPCRARHVAPGEVAVPSPGVLPGSIGRVIRVLVVDDHPVLRAGLEAALRAEPGFVAVGAAADGDETLRLVRRTRPDVVVLDRRLADEDGIALCRRLREEPRAPQVVLYTGADDQDAEDGARVAGAFAVVGKTADVAALFDAVRLAARSVAPAVDG